MNRSPSEVQRSTIAEIVKAVRAGEGWRVGLLMDLFVEDADLPALFALRSALEEARSDGDL